MKKGWIILIFAVLCTGFTACQEAGGETASVLSEGTSSVRTLLDGKTSIFNHIEINGGDAITADLDAYLSQTEAPFLYVEVTEDTEVDLHYTYSTQDQTGVALGYEMDGSDAKTIVELAAKPDSAFRRDWTDTKITLQKGTTIFYLSGENRNCKLYFELNAENPDSIAYADLTRRGKG